DSTSDVSGGTLRRYAAIPALVVILVSGCGAPQPAPEASESPSSSGSSQKPEPSAVTQTSKAVFQVSEKTACTQLLGTDSDGPLFGVVSLVTELDSESDGAAVVEKARLLDEEVSGIGEHAPDNLVPLLAALSGPMDDIIGLADGTQTSSDLNLPAWKAAATELLTLCGPYDRGPGSRAAPAPTKSKADEISAAYPGYPLIVNVASLDWRVRSSLEGKLVNGQVVALAPGLYTPFNPNVRDLKSYYESGSVTGDSAMKNAVLPNMGGSTWSGVLPGSDEPQ
ncbi:hypothetical protein, partial [Pseudarthrobacter oxydans]|uniref:hypothetical protein n=1 Tax=Pseudarthrobacter oxydans TaxID=1671 RepID=UPI001C2CC76F